MTSEVSLSIPLNCTCVAELSRRIVCVSCGFKESAKRDVSSISFLFFFYASLSSDSEAMATVVDYLMSIHHVRMSTCRPFCRPGSSLQA